ncbi:DUF2544 domain-containing protein [Escherichia coli]
MKKIHHTLCLMLLFFCASGAIAAQKIATLNVVAGIMGPLTGYEFDISILTPDGVQYGVYTSRSTSSMNVTNVSWTGSDTAPELILEDAYNNRLPDENCPGLVEYDARTDQTKWGCSNMRIGVYYDGDLHGCPWIVSTFIKSTDRTEVIYTGNSIPYVGPVGGNSSCPTVSLAPYDVSWNENYVVHNKVVRLQSTGAVIEQTLPTFLMENGKLCDGSSFDERGAYCRFVAQQMTFSTSGCDNAKVTVTAEQQPVTSRQLHDMKLRVDTTAQQPIDSTCRFTYILNMY